MGVSIDGASGTRYTYIEYQALMIVLALGTCVGLGFIELLFRRFQVLPLLFPGMFTIRERRFLFFDMEIADHAVGQSLRHEVKMLTRLTLVVVFSYLWQSCVLETQQIVGKEFPVQQCAEDKDCFASELHYWTLVSREHSAISCDGPPTPFKRRMVVSCVRFVQPTAQDWLMNLAIAHSATQLAYKCHEMMVWVGGSSLHFRRMTMTLALVSFAFFIWMYVGGDLSEIVTSWLAFVMGLSAPLFFLLVYREATLLDKVHRAYAQHLQERVEEHFVAALADTEVPLAEDSQKRGLTRSTSLTGHALKPTSLAFALVAMGARTARQLLRSGSSTSTIADATGSSSSGTGLPPRFADGKALEVGLPAHSVEKAQISCQEVLEVDADLYGRDLSSIATWDSDRTEAI